MLKKDFIMINEYDKTSIDSYSQISKR